MLSTVCQEWYNIKVFLVELNQETYIDWK